MIAFGRVLPIPAVFTHFQVSIIIAKAFDQWTIWIELKQPLPKVCLKTDFCDGKRKRLRKTLRTPVLHAWKSASAIFWYVFVCGSYNLKFSELANYFEIKSGPLGNLKRNMIWRETTQENETHIARSRRLWIHETAKIAVNYNILKYQKSAHVF